MTREDTVVLLESLAEILNYPLDRHPDQIRIWCRLLAPYPRSLVEPVVDAYVLTHVFWPKPAEILGPLHADVSAELDQAWGQVQAQIRAVGRYGHPTFTDAATAEAVHTLGWTTLCDGTADVVRSQFFRIYPGIRDRLRAQAIVRQLRIPPALPDESRELP